MTKKIYAQLSESDRQGIALGLQQGPSLSAIARALGRSKSTISRECSRNGGGAGCACRFAQQRSDRRRLFARPSPNCTAMERCSNSCATICACTGRPSKLPPSSSISTPQTGANECPTRASTPASMPSPGASSRRIWSLACVWRAPSAGRAPGERIGVDRSPTC